MLSINLKKKVAVLLTGAMVLGMTVTAAAADPIEVTGSGSSEGHVNMTVMDVTLPTAAANAETFKYIVDAEGLVKATAHARYGEDVSFPAVGSDTSVYFQTDTKKYENKSKNLTVSNNSSVSINLTVKVEVTSADTDVDLVSKNALAKAKTPSLYLGLKVGDKEPAAVTKDKGATVSISLNKAGGYSVSWNSTKSEYEYIRGEGAPAAPTLDFYVEGATNPELGSAEGKTAPALKVTWKYDAAGGDTPAPAADKAPSAATTTYKKSENTNGITAAIDFGSGSLKATSMTSVKWSSDKSEWKTYSNATNCVLDNTNKQVKFSKDYINSLAGTRYVRVYFDGAETTYVEFTLLNS